MPRYGIRKMFPHATKALQIIMIRPATSSVSERSFSKLKLLKKSLTCIMWRHPTRLSHLMTCSIYIGIRDVHKDVVMNIPLNLLANVSIRISD